MGFFDNIIKGRHDAVVEKMYEKKDVESLIHALKDKDKQEKAAEKLGYLGDSRAIDPLIEVLFEGKFISCMYAIYALKNLKAKKAVEPLTQLFLKNEGITTPSIISESLYQETGQKIDASKLGALASYQNNNAAQTRMFIVEALGEIGDERGLVIIKRGLNDIDTRVKRAAEQAYIKIEPPELELTAYPRSEAESWRSKIAKLKKEEDRYYYDKTEYEKIHSERQRYERYLEQHMDGIGVYADKQHGVSYARFDEDSSFEHLFHLHVWKLIDAHLEWKPFLVNHVPAQEIREIFKKAYEMKPYKWDPDSVKDAHFSSGSVFFDIRYIPTSIANSAKWFQKNHHGYLNYLEEELGSQNFQYWDHSIFCTILFGEEPQTGKWVNMGIFPGKDSAPTYNILWPTEALTLPEQRFVDNYRINLMTKNGFFNDFKK